MNRLGRRRFLAGAAAATAAVAVGCSSDEADDAADDATKATTTTTAPVVAPEPTNVPELAADPFTLGVASGDPTTTSVILWTRLAPEPTADDGAAGMPGEDADVVWEVAEDDTFERLVAAGVFVTEPGHGHSAHVDVTDLAPGADYRYRFRYADWTSPVGRTRTLPEGSPTSYGIGIVNCQMYESGHYAAYRHLLDEDIDLVVHLGDYLYEYPFKILPDRPVLPDRYLETVGDFRLRYAVYKADPDLQAAHHRFPFVSTWDDHEVANNYMGDLLANDDPAAAEPKGVALKAAAYQAWWENLPTRFPAPDGSRLDIFQAVTVGDLLRLYILDERQYSDLPPCRDSAIAGTDYGDCDERLGEDRERLGDDQSSWLADSLGEGGVTWNLLGNPVVLAGVNGGIDEDAYYLDTWDGFPQARRRLIDHLAAVDNPVVLTGDYHAGMVLDVRAEPFDQSSALVATEFMAPAISSPLFADDISARTPQLRQQINEHGYLTVTVTPDDLTATFRCLDDVKKADATISTTATWVVEAGDPEPAKR
jgi:alkaline phosphatase D